MKTNVKIVSFILLLTLTVVVEAQTVAEAIRKALANQKALSQLEINLWYHSGDKDAGHLTHISGDGTVKTTNHRLYPILTSETVTISKLRLKLTKREVARIAQMFSDDSILKLPKVLPELIEPKDKWPKHMRYSANIIVDEAVLHEFEHPEVEFFKLKQIPVAKSLINSIQSAVSNLERTIVVSDRKYLTKDRIYNLLGDREENLWIELNDIQGLWGGKAIRLSDHGVVYWVTVRRPLPHESGMQMIRSHKRIDDDTVRMVFYSCLEEGVLDIKRQRKVGIPDEGRPKITVYAIVNGEEYSRSIWLWSGESDNTINFKHIRQLMLVLASDINETHNNRVEATK